MLLLRDGDRRRFAEQGEPGVPRGPHRLHQQDRGPQPNAQAPAQPAKDQERVHEEHDRRPQPHRVLRAELRVTIDKPAPLASPERRKAIQQLQHQQEGLNRVRQAVLAQEQPGGPELQLRHRRLEAPRARARPDPRDGRDQQRGKESAVNISVEQS